MVYGDYMSAKSSIKIDHISRVKRFHCNDDNRTFCMCVAEEFYEKTLNCNWLVISEWFGETVNWMVRANVIQLKKYGDKLCIWLKFGCGWRDIIVEHRKNMFCYVAFRFGCMEKDREDHR